MSNEALKQVEQWRNQFNNAADRLQTRRFWTPWFGDTSAQDAKEFKDYATTLDRAFVSLRGDETTEARAQLASLKSVFEGKAQEMKNFKRGFWTDWNFDAKAEARRYDGYAQKTDTILQLL